MVTVIVLVFLLVLFGAAVYGYRQGTKRNKPYEAGVLTDEERASFVPSRPSTFENPAFNPRQRQSLPSVQAGSLPSTPASRSDRSENRESALPATVPSRKPHGRPSARQDWTSTTDDTPVQHFTVSTFSSYHDSGSSSSSSYDSSSSDSSYSGGGGDSGGGGASSDW